jgi:hypothetical protein
LIFLVLATLGFFIDWKEPAPSAWEKVGVDVYRAGWIIAGSTGLALYVRVISLIFKVLKKA